MRSLFWALGIVLVIVSSCAVQIIEDSSAFALVSGQATMILGSDCSRPMSLGYDVCQIKKSDTVPALHLWFMNPAEYAVSDCGLGLYKTGSTDRAGEVVIDLSALTLQAQTNRFCMLRIEAKERYPNPKDHTQLSEIPFAGGFFIEVLDDNYFPSPSDAVVSWCYKVSSTNKGRRKIEPCK